MKVVCAICRRLRNHYITAYWRDDLTMVHVPGAYGRFEEPELRAVLLCSSVCSWNFKRASGANWRSYEKASEDIIRWQRLLDSWQQQRKDARKAA